MQSPRKVVLITGASSGIGRASAELLAAKGFRVLAGMRRRGAQNDLPAPPAGCEAIGLDVTNEDNVAALVERLQRECPDGLFGLVNNAGVAPPAATELAGVDELRRVLEVNTVAPLRMIQQCLPLLRQGSGRIINMSSMNGTVSMPLVGVYSASKFALEALSDALRLELRPWAIPVSVIRPGQIATEIFDKAAAAVDERSQCIPADLLDGYALLYGRARTFVARGAKSPIGPDAVARKVLKALRARRPKSRYFVGLDAVGMQIAYDWLPTPVMDWIMATVMGTGRRIPRVAGTQALGRGDEQGVLANTLRASASSPLTSPPRQGEGARGR
jgi:NAD(P)-dependent dehydrogenase (short-subunit alcohol dehydrogenase family)